MNPIAVFTAAFEAVSGHVHCVPDTAAAAEVIAELIYEYGARRVAFAQVPDALFQQIEVQCSERNLGASELVREPYEVDSALELLDGAQMGITWAAFAIAQTGTLVEVTRDDAHRLVSALPRVHVGIVDARQLVPTMVDAAGPLRQALASASTNVAVSFISGPSRTGDIEMILTLGVHGPEEAHAIIIANDRSEADETGDRDGAA